MPTKDIIAIVAAIVVPLAIGIIGANLINNFVNWMITVRWLSN